MNAHALLLYNKVIQAANESNHSALYYAVLWGYTEIIVYLMKDAQNEGIDVQDAFNLAQSNTIALPDPNCLRMFCNKICAYYLNIKMYYFRKKELDELLFHSILLDTLSDIATEEKKYDRPSYLASQQYIPTTAQTHEIKYKDIIEPIHLQNYLKKTISKTLKAPHLNPKRKTRPRPPIGVPAINLHFKRKDHASNRL